MTDEGGQKWSRKGTAVLLSSLSYWLSSLAKAEGMEESNCGVHQQSAGYLCSLMYC